MASSGYYCNEIFILTQQILTLHERYYLAYASETYARSDNARPVNTTVIGPTVFFASSQKDPYT